MRLMTIKRIVVGIDFSDGSDVAMEQALSLAAVFKATVDIVHVLDPIVLRPVATSGVASLADAPALVDQIDRALASRATKAAELGVACQTKLLEGHPAQEIVEYANKTGADMIVVGTHGRTGIQHAVLGSVAERVVQRSTCPVVVIPRPRA